MKPPPYPHVYRDEKRIVIKVERGLNAGSVWTDSLTLTKKEARLVLQRLARLLATKDR